MKWRPQFLRILITYPMLPAPLLSLELLCQGRLLWTEENKGSSPIPRHALFLQGNSHPSAKTTQRSIRPHDGRNSICVSIAQSRLDAITFACTPKVRDFCGMSCTDHCLFMMFLGLPSTRHWHTQYLQEGGVPPTHHCLQSPSKAACNMFGSMSGLKRYPFQKWSMSITAKHIGFAIINQLDCRRLRPRTNPPIFSCSKQTN